MKLPVTLLALGLAATTGTAPAQARFNQAGNQAYFNPQVNQPVQDRYGQDSHAVYDWARVIRVDPVIGSREGRYNTVVNQRNCYTRRSTYAGNDGYRNDGGYYDPYGNDGYYDPRGGYGNDYGSRGYGNRGSETGRTMATVIGGIVGAAIGSQVGGGSARYATSAIGSMVGGIAGREIYESSQRDRYRSGTVRVCDPVPVDSYYGSGGYDGYTVGNRQVTGYDVTYEYAGRQFHTYTDHHPGDRIRVRVDVRPQ